MPESDRPTRRIHSFADMRNLEKESKGNLRASSPKEEKQTTKNGGSDKDKDKSKDNDKDKSKDKDNDKPKDKDLDKPKDKDLDKPKDKDKDKDEKELSRFQISQSSPSTPQHTPSGTNSFFITSLK